MSNPLKFSQILSNPLDKTQTLIYTLVMGQKEFKEFMDLKEVAEYLGVDVSTLYRYMKDDINPLPTFLILGKTLRVKKAELDDWLDGYKKY